MPTIARPPSAELSFQLEIHPSRYATLDLGYQRPAAWAALQALDWRSPALTVGDEGVAWFDWGRQELALTAEASERFRRAVRVTGRGNLAHPQEHAFRVSLGGEGLYGGILLASISAMGIGFPVIYVNDRTDFVELRIRPTHSASTPYEKLPSSDRSAIEHAALREHFAGTRRLVGDHELPATFPVDVPSGSGDYRWALAMTAAYRRGEISFADLRAEVLARKLPPHRLGCKYLLVSPPPPPPPHQFDPRMMPADWQGTWGEVAMSFLLGGLDKAEYDLLHRAAHPDEP